MAPENPDTRRKQQNQVKEETEGHDLSLLVEGAPTVPCIEYGSSPEPSKELDGTSVTLTDTESQSQSQHSDTELEDDGIDGID